MLRKDFCGCFVVIIDGEIVKDFDDVVWVEKMGKGYCVDVYIVDVVYFVKFGIVFDDVVKMCGIFVYFLGCVVLMLFFEFFEDVCLLMLDEECLMMFVMLWFDGYGEIE